MLIDWFTVVAQVINFLILLWLLQRFLYKPILSAVDARETLIAAELADAAAKKADAEKDRDEFQHKNDEFDKQRADLLTAATDAAKAEGQRLLDESRKTTAALAAKQQESLKSDIDGLYQSISSRAQQEVFAIARKALTDLSGATLEERTVDVFIRRLQALSAEQKTLLRAPNTAPAGPVFVRSAFDLPSEQRASVESAVKEITGPETQVQFETVPDLIGGIELTANGQKVAWSIADYLSSLEKGVDELVKEKATAPPAPEVGTGKPEPKIP